jgi:hypothetical protein
MKSPIAASTTGESIFLFHFGGDGTDVANHSLTVVPSPNVTKKTAVELIDALSS